MGISDEDANNNACIVAAVYNKAIKGNKAEKNQNGFRIKRL